MAITYKFYWCVSKRHLSRRIIYIIYKNFQIFSFFVCRSFVKANLTFIRFQKFNSDQIDRFLLDDGSLAVVNEIILENIKKLIVHDVHGVDEDYVKKIEKKNTIDNSK